MGRGSASRGTHRLFSRQGTWTKSNRARCATTTTEGLMGWARARRVSRRNRVKDHGTMLGPELGV